jgi:hypothetical protein
VRCHFVPGLFAGSQYLFGICIDGADEEILLGHDDAEVAVL